MSQNTSFTWEEIKKHSTEHDAWVVIDGYVHDVTNFSRMHPGGEKILRHKYGTDATQAFLNPNVHTHSESARTLLEKLRIGTVQESQRAESSKPFVRKDHGIDLDRGIVSQMAKLGHKYTSTLHAIGIANKLELRLFDNSFLESFTVCFWWLVPLVWLPIVIWGFITALKAGLPAPFFFIPFYVLIGGLSWGLIEYTLHRYLFHLEPQSYLMNGFHFMIHGQHHVNPMNPRRLVFPPTGALPIVILGYLFITSICPYCFAVAHFAGGLLGYILYDLTHFYLHHGNPTSGILKQLKTHHVIHHFKNPNANYAISLFALPYDWLFGTWVVDENKSK